MPTSRRFTDYRVPDLGVRALFALESRWQAWLDVEATLAAVQAELGMVPNESAARIIASSKLECLDLERVHDGIARSSHPLVPLIVELSRVAGDPHGGWVHWGATTQNITQTGDTLIIKAAHALLLTELGEVLAALGDLADRGADMVMAGRTFGQHAVPTTFGFKVAVWVDEIERHVARFRQAEPRLLVCMTGGAIGTFASLGAAGPQLQARIAERLGLEPMAVPARSIADHFAEYVCVLGLLAASCGKIGREVFMLMKPEFGEAAESAPTGTVGSSTMPHKRNPQLCQDVIAIAAQIRSLVPLALEGMNHEHEVDGAAIEMVDLAIGQACVLAGDLLARVHLIVEGLELDARRMRANIALSNGLIMSEAVMLALGMKIGRQTAHHVVYEASVATRSARGTFEQALSADPRVTAHLSPVEIQGLLDPANYTGLSADLARRGARRARLLAAELRGPPSPVD